MTEWKVAFEIQIKVAFPKTLLKEFCNSKFALLGLLTRLACAVQMHAPKGQAVRSVDAVPVGPLYARSVAAQLLAISERVGETLSNIPSEYITPSYILTWLLHFLLLFYVFSVKSVFPRCISGAAPGYRKHYVPCCSCSLPTDCPTSGRGGGGESSLSSYQGGLLPSSILSVCLTHRWALKSVLNHCVLISLWRAAYNSWFASHTV